MMPSNIVLVRSLANYLRNELEITVYDGWPDPKEQMQLPCISIMVAGTPQYTHKMPVQFSLITEEDETTEVTEIGEYNYRIQIDLWAEYPAKRDELYELVHKALNKQFYDSDAPMGLTLTLENYHGAIARVDQTGYTNMDNGDSSQRSEWRIKIDCTANHSKLAERKVNLIKELTTETTISESANVVDETFEIF